jgi:putative membrane protein
MPAHFLATLPNFLSYLSAAAVLLTAFITIYLFITPYDEIKLIRENNVAASPCPSPTSSPTAIRCSTWRCGA